MITTLRGMRRSMTDLAMWGEVADALLDLRTGQWATLADLDPKISACILSVHPLLTEWERVGWVERKIDSGRTMWRATTQLGTGPWGLLMRAVAEVPVR